VTSSPRIKLEQRNSLVCGNEFRRVRTKNTYRRSCDEAEWDLLRKLHETSKEDGTAGSSHLQPLGWKDGMVKYERKKPRWEVFEDKIWQMFYHLGTPIMPIGKTVVKFGKGRYKQIDGLFCDQEYVYVVECKSKLRKGKVDQPPGEIVHDLERWRGIWGRLQSSLEEVEQFKGKKFRFILATTGVQWTKALLEEGREFASFIDQSSIDEVIDLSKMIGESARTNLLQKLFMGEDLPGDPISFPCIRSEIGGANTYYFFAEPSKVIDQCYVPRRSPGSTKAEQLYGLGTSYQRMLKPKKVNQIRDYLNDAHSFFPNSIVASADHVVFVQTDEAGAQGFLWLPHQYGSVKVIDGQHRMFGSINTKGGEKPLPFCVVSPLDGLGQSRLFTLINQKQTTVPTELLWDLYGEDVDLGSIDENDRSQIKMARNFVISNIWKSINQKQKHPLCGRLFIPSQTHKDSDLCHISFGQVCSFLAKNQTLWTHGYLKGEGDWASALKFAEFRVERFFRYLHHYLPDEFDRPMNGRKKDNWLLSNYAFEPLIALFTHACLFFGGSQAYRGKWLKSNHNIGKGNALELLNEFTEVLSRALVDEKRGFYNEAGERDIRQQGNSAQRGAYMKDIVKFILDDKPSYKGHFAPLLDIPEDDEDGDYPSAETKTRAEVLEQNYTELIHKTLVNNFGKNWYNYIPRDVEEYIAGQIEYKTMHLREFSKKADLEWLEQTTVSDLLKIVQQKSVVSPWKETIGRSESMFEHQWKLFVFLRNMIAHGDPYPPNDDYKSQIVASLGVLETWLDDTTRDDTPPVIELLGDPEVSIIQGSDYADEGAIAEDDVDGDISEKIVIEGADFDTENLGIHTIRYNVSDSSGNEATEIYRTVNVVSID